MFLENLWFITDDEMEEVIKIGGKKDWSYCWGWPRETLLKAWDIPISPYPTQSTPTQLLYRLSAWKTLQAERALAVSKASIMDNIEAEWERQMFVSKK